MNDDPTPWDNATESSTALPGEVSPQDGYVLLLALLSIFIGGTLVLLSGILIICRRCCEAERRHSRASDDPEKTTTTYLDDSQQAQDITIKVEDPECLSASSYRDAESERFLSSSSSSARRVSFNEAALYEQGKKTQEKGRRYTLTEGDFHHLKNARLTHLHLPPPALKIVTIHECESSENSLAMTPRRPPPKPGFAIFQPPGGAVPQPGHAVCPSSALPGDTYNSTAGGSPATSSDSGEGPSFTAAPRSGKGPIVGSASPGDAPPAPTQGPVLQFFTRLRRHASLDGASPYFRIKKWKLESTQRASSLDTRGSPKRRQFQRQRAASESMDQEDRDPHQTDIIQYIAHTDDVAFHSAGGPFLPSPSSPPPSLGRYFSVRAGRGQPQRGGGPGAAQRRPRHLEPPRLAGAVRRVGAQQRPGLGAQRRSGQRLVGRRGPLPLLLPGRGRRPRGEALGPAQGGGFGTRHAQAAADGQRLRLHRGAGPGGRGGAARGSNGVGETDLLHQRRAEGHHLRELRGPRARRGRGRGGRGRGGGGSAARRGGRGGSDAHPQPPGLVTLRADAGGPGRAVAEEGLQHRREDGRAVQRLRAARPAVRRIPASRKTSLPHAPPQAVAARQAVQRPGGSVPRVGTAPHPSAPRGQRQLPAGRPIPRAAAPHRQRRGRRSGRGGIRRRSAARTRDSGDRGGARRGAPDRAGARRRGGMPRTGAVRGAASRRGAAGQDCGRHRGAAVRASAEGGGGAAGGHGERGGPNSRRCPPRSQPRVGRTRCGSARCAGG